MILATKTKEAIDACIEADGGNSFRELQRTYMPLMEDAYRSDEDGVRGHLGASLIGRECARELWYSFRWAHKHKPSGRIMRLWNRGHLEEARFLAMLRAIGCKVHFEDENGKQFRIKGYKGHAGGALDAVVENCPDLPSEPILGEFKTHGEKSFKKLEKNGVMAEKWEHFVQMQLYMGHYALAWALYMAVNKNTDELHCELIAFDPSQYARYNERFGIIIDAPAPPPKINNNPSWFKCRFCDQSPVCHDGVEPERNCRTCHYVSFCDNGIVYCHEHDVLLSLKKQIVGCQVYTKNRSL